jgi:ABC-2 type transport system ATP-binding protein
MPVPPVECNGRSEAPREGSHQFLDFRNVGPHTGTMNAPDQNVVIETFALAKSFGTIQAVDSVSLSVSPGCTGLLGPNGAGKSTLIKLLLGLLPADAGEARVMGIDPKGQALKVRSVVGYMPEHNCLPSDWLAQDFVRYMAELHGLPRREAIQRASDALYHVGLGEERYRAIGGFSTGMKQRVKLAQALAHDPSILFLDEPTNGLDPVGRDEMLALIQRITGEMNLNVFLSSHLLSDVEHVADHVIIIARGRVVVQGVLRDLIQSTPMVTVRIHEPVSPFALALQARGCKAEIDGGDVHVPYTSDDVYDAIRDAAIETHCAITYLMRRKLSLQDVYLASQDAETQESGRVA